MTDSFESTDITMESSLPDSLTSTPLAPVAFVGLDVPNEAKATGRHTAIWQAFTAERSPDRVPLKVRTLLIISFTFVLKFCMRCSLFLYSLIACMYLVYSINRARISSNETKKDILRMVYPERNTKNQLDG